jgi:hypothetical protein
MTSRTQFLDGILAGMQMLYGEGFLLPGGSGEVEQLLSDTAPAGMRLGRFGLHAGA